MTGPTLGRWDDPWPPPGRVPALTLIGRATLEPAQLVAVWDRAPVPAGWPPVRGIISPGRYLIDDTCGTVTWSWPGSSGTVPVGVLWEVARVAGSQSKRDELVVALADAPAAMRACDRYIRAHDPLGSKDGAVLPYGHDTPQWRACLARLNAVRAARAGWWTPREPTDLLELLAMG